MEALETYVVRQGDRALVLAQRLLEMVAHAPEIEEDMALSNLALDLIGQSRALYTYAGSLESGRSEDDYAFTRTDTEFMNPLLVEQPNADFAHVIARQYLHDVFAVELWHRLTDSADATIAAIAERAAKESDYHLRHSRGWLVRLGDGTAESHDRMTAAVEWMWRYTAELFEYDDVDAAMVTANIAPDPNEMRSIWNAKVAAGLNEATVPLPDSNTVMASGGRHGQHTEAFSYLIGEMQVVARAHPGASW